MSNATADAAIFNLSKPARLIYENLFEAKAVGPKGATTGTPKFDVSLMLDPSHPDLPAIQAKMLEVARAKWPGRDVVGEAKDVDANGIPKAVTFKFPLASGDKLADKAKAKAQAKAPTADVGDPGGFQRGKVVIASRSKYEPNLSAAVNGQLSDFNGPQRPAAKPYFYRGVDVLAQFNFVAYDGVGANPDGVTAYLNMVCSLNTGEKIAGSQRSASDVFKGYVGLSSTVDPTAGGAERIPF